jgi:hypothetical protein
MCAIGNVQGMGTRGSITPNWRLLLEIVIDGMRAR